ncbi:MAG: hypothetical protein IJR71_07655 [Prevotella sp.]|nr:hypothetical protein [Prevotella sp.]
MKKYLLMAAALLAATMTFTACGDDDEKSEEAIEDIVSGKTKPTVTINETADKIVMTAEWKNAYTEVHTATFDSNGLLTSYTVASTYATDALADAAWKAAQEADGEDADLKVTRNGKTITADYTKEYPEVNKEMMRSVFETIKKQYESMNQK